MTVAELIAKLQTMPQGMQIVVRDDEEGWSQATGAEIIEAHFSVWEPFESADHGTVTNLSHVSGEVVFIN